MMNGAVIFKLMDTYGLPVMVVNAHLRKLGTGFNVPEFVEAARRAGWKDRSIRTALLDDLISKEAEQRINELLP